MADKEVIRAMMEKVIKGQQDQDDLRELFISMAADLGVERNVPEPEPEPEPVPEPAPEDDNSTNSFFGS